MQTIAMRPRKVLVVDDYPDTCEVLEMMFQAEGHQVFKACNGSVALKLAHQYVPDVIMTDICIPGLDGLSLGKQLRSNSKFDSSVLVAHTSRDLSQKAAESGFDYFVVKPVDAATLISTTYAPRQEYLIILSLALIKRSDELQRRSRMVSERSLLAITRSKAIIAKMMGRRGKRP